MAEKALIHGLFRQNNLISGSLNDLNETSEMIASADWADIQLAAKFLETQVFSDCGTQSVHHTGRTFAIARKDMTKRFGRICAASRRLRNAVIMHRDYKDCIRYSAGPDTFILLDPPYKGTEYFYNKADFASSEHDLLFSFMSEIHEKYRGGCRFLITYNNDPSIRDLAEHYGFYTFVEKRLHNMAQGSDPGAQFEELLICNYDPIRQAEENGRRLSQQVQLSFFDALPPQ